MPSAITIDDSDVLLAIDLQADFMPGGALAVDEGDSVVPLVNALMNRFAHVVVTQDWHPPGHASFASTHGAEPFATKRLHYGEQTLWPDHCVRGTPGAALHAALATDKAFLIRKGMHAGVDSYSATRVACSPAVLRPTIASPFPRSTRAAEFESFVIEDACRAIDANDSLDAAWAKMNAAKVRRIESREIFG